jgi:hypothetical protein
MTEKSFEGTRSDKNNSIPFALFCWRIIAIHMIAYLIAAVFAQFTFNYRELLKSETLSLIMRPWESPLVALGPFLQSVNGFFIALILYRIRHLIINVKDGWLTLFLIVAGFSIFAPQAPGPGTFEGFIYTKLPISEHIIGLPECLLYSFLFSFGVYQWFQKPKRIWNILSIFGIVIITLMSLLGVLASIGIIKQP